MTSGEFSGSYPAILKRIDCHISSLGKFIIHLYHRQDLSIIVFERNYGKDRKKHNVWERDM